MSATGMGFYLWPPNDPAPGKSALPHVTTPVVLYLADRELSIVHIFLHNMATAPADVLLGITHLGTAMVPNDGRKFYKRTLEVGQTVDLGVRIPLHFNWSLMGTASAALGDEMVYAAITGEVND